MKAQGPRVQYGACVEGWAGAALLPAEEGLDSAPQGAAPPGVRPAGRSP